MDLRASTSNLPPLAAGLVAALAGVKLLLHFGVAVVTPYELHRDELLYLAMGRHLEFWRMDFPPAIAVLAEAARGVFGDTLFAVRFFPAVFGTALVVLAALLARAFGGGRFAQGLAALAVLANVLFLRSASLFQPVVLDQVAWTAGFLALARIARVPDDRRGWLLLGLAAGFGLLAKHSILFFGLAAAAGLLLTPLRARFLTAGPWLALAVALLAGSATLVGQLRLGFPIVPQLQALREAQLERITPVEFVVTQLLFGPTVLLAALGAWTLLAGERLRAFRVIGWTAAAAFLLLLLLQGKAYYFGPAYPALFAAGAVRLEAFSGRGAARARGVAVALIVGYAALLLPVGLPVLPPPVMARYSAALGLTPALKTNQGEVGRLPQDYADMLGWEDQVRLLARVYHGLPPDERRHVVIAAANYGEAGAVDFYGPRYGLPPVVSDHTSFWFFGPGNRPGLVLLTIGIPRESLAPLYRSIRPAGRHTNPWGVSEEQDVPLYLAAGPYRTLQEAWPSLAGRY